MTRRSPPAARAADPGRLTAAGPGHFELSGNVGFDDAARLLAVEIPVVVAAVAFAFGGCYAGLRFNRRMLLDCLHLLPAMLFGILLLIGSCIALMWSSSFFTNSLANLDTWNSVFPWIAAVVVAASTMGMWASERSNGTQELLFTLPATEFDLQFGKFLAYVMIYTASLGFTLVLPAALVFLGNPDWGQLFANYVGLWLFGLMLVSVSMIGS